MSLIHEANQNERFHTTEGRVNDILDAQRTIRGNIWGWKHIPIDFVIKGLPEHYINTHKGKKAVEKVLK